MLKKDKLFLFTTIGFVLGIVLGLVCPQVSINTKIIGDSYLNLIKMLITPIVFCSVYCGIIGIKDQKALGKLGVKTIGLFTLLFITCAIITVCICSVVKPGNGVVFDNIAEWTGSVVSPTVSSFLSKIIPSNLLSALVSGDTLSIIMFTIVFGVATVVLSDSNNKLAKDCSLVVEKNIIGLKDILYKVFEWFMYLTPIGVCSLMAYSVSYYGAGLFSSLGKYILVCWGCCIFCFVFVLYLPTLFITKCNPIKLLKACGKVATVAMSTTSSAATLPTTIKTCVEDLEIPENTVNFIAPLGCTIHMCGGACSFMCLLMFTSQFYGIILSVPTIIIGVLVATLMNMAAPGIPGGGIVLGASFLTIMGLPIELIGPYAGIYRLLDMIYTTMNVEGDVVANVLINHSLNKENN